MFDQNFSSERSSLLPELPKLRTLEWDIYCWTDLALLHEFTSSIAGICPDLQIVMWLNDPVANIAVIKRTGRDGVETSVDMKQKRSQYLPRVLGARQPLLWAD